MPFEAHGRGVSLSSAYWKKESDDIYNANSFRNLEDDGDGDTTQSIPPLQPHDWWNVAGLWTIRPLNSSKSARSNLPNATLEIGIFTILATICLVDLLDSKEL